MSGIASLIVVVCAAAIAIGQETSRQPTSDRKQPTAHDKKSKEKRGKDTDARFTEWLKEQPLVLVRESNPWAGSGGATLALYEDGTLIYWSPGPEGGEYKSTHLSPELMLDFLAHIEPVDWRNARDSLLPCNGLLLDAPCAIISVRRAGEFPKSLDFVGSLRGSSRGLPNKLPEPLGRMLTFLATYERVDAVEWIPKVVEVSLWPTTRGSEPDLDWPVALPGLKGATRNASEGYYMLQVSKEQFEELRPILDERRPGQMFRIDGKRWLVEVRFPFPHERQAAARAKPAARE